MFADPAAQRACWHPVAFAGEVADRPVRADLLGEPLVVWRGAGGAPRVMSDLCVHRGTALSLGWIQGDELVCAYHGWRYAADGRCVAIPQKEDPAVVPAKARVPAFRVQERYGLIWVALEEPRWPLPEVPELEAGEWVIVAAGPYRWRCDAARQVENFTDFGHFPWVHPGLLGDPSRPVVPRHQVDADGHVLRYQIVRPEAVNSEEFPVFGNEQAGPPDRRSRYELHLPYTIVLRLGWGGPRGMVYFFASQPVSADGQRLGGPVGPAEGAAVGALVVEPLGEAVAKGRKGTNRLRHWPMMPSTAVPSTCARILAAYMCLAIGSSRHLMLELRTHRLDGVYLPVRDMEAAGPNLTCLSEVKLSKEGEADDRSGRSARIIQCCSPVV
ncbi:MAG: Rieske 2Fe-2S domain-containing protein [Streptosporangiaceae bacterium]